MSDISYLSSSDLLKKATELKSIDDMYGAIECLKRFKQITDEAEDGHTIQSYLRLPLYMQQAGFFDDAMREFRYLLDNNEGVINKTFSHQPKSIRRMLGHARLFSIYDKMRLACERQGELSLANDYKKLYKKHKNAHARAMENDNKKTIQRRSEAATTVKPKSEKLPMPPVAKRTVKVVVKKESSIRDFFEGVLGFAFLGGLAYGGYRLIKWLILIN
ncbi:hypothetical protein KJE99_003761 [Salmonella enterica]|nr:hypothetical protein [Salmonella enterica]